MKKSKIVFYILVLMCFFILAVFLIFYSSINLFISNDDRDINQNITDVLSDVREVLIVDSDNGCKDDDDCFLTLINDFGCLCGYVCGNYFCNGECEPVDLSSDRWVAVNKAWFTKNREANCSSATTAGACPNCLSRPVNENFIARCIENVCRKDSL